MAAPSLPRDAASPPPPWVALVLVLAVVAAYANSLGGPFVFDDLPAIRDNPTLDGLVSALSPPSAEGNTVGGRPLLNLSFALNRALGGHDVRGFHVANLLIHAAATLALFGVLRRLFARRAHPHAAPIACVTALLWGVHPLGTAAVTYLVQRAESLTALLILITVYGFLRATDVSARAGRWLALSAAGCWAAAATKETAAVAPLLVLAIDALFVAGGVRAALRARPGYHAALAASWLLLGWLVAGTAGRGGSVGLDTPITPWTYLLTQAHALGLYLRLAAWPQPLVFDYGSPVITSPAAAVLPGLLLLAALGVAGWALFRRRSLAGFAGLAFFLLLSPTSSIVPITTQTIAEHRMYLPLAAVLGLAVALTARLAGPRGVLVLALAALPLGWATAARNRTYASAETLWVDTVAKRPANPRAHNNLGLLHAESGRLDEAIRHFESALQLAPENPGALNNLANALRRTGRAAAALPYYERALQLQPGSGVTRLNYANALHQAGRTADAVAAFELAARLTPPAAEDLANHGAALLALDRAADAIPVLQHAVQTDPSHARAHYNLGNAFARLTRWDDAIRHYREAVRLQPDYLPALANLGNSYLVSGRPAEAAAAYEAALRLRPDDPRLRASLARARALSPRSP